MRYGALGGLPASLPVLGLLIVERRRNRSDDDQADHDEGGNDVVDDVEYEAVQETKPC